MPTKFYNVEKAAEVLGVSPAEINAMRERQELHGYRDGADWKFRAEEIDVLAAQGPPASPDTSSDEDVLLSEVELGHSDSGSSGTVIGPPPDEALFHETKSDLGSSLSGFEDLDLTLGDSQLDLSVDSSTGSSSGLELAGDELDDDDLVLGGSGAGSDITIGGDSGISLVDPADSGLSLEEPLDLVGSGHESLQLGEDEVLSLEEAADSEAPTALNTEGDFLLTPLDEAGEDDQSGSQVIALESEEDLAPEGLPAMLDADVVEELEPIAPVPAARGRAAAPVMDSPVLAASRDYAAMSAQAAAGPPAAVLPEAPYSAWNILSLAGCTVILVVVGMFMVDLMWNMWSWGGTYRVNSWLMDLIS
ncbi:MAG: helix-turn-helix domain-containing protein [Pirellulales bacterium]|nr:helix-turn-helix domain-containing protein [Pirellulales bacterium]